MTDLAPVNAFSCDHEDERVLKLHFNRKVTDEDRKWLLDAINAWWPARESPLSHPLHPAQTLRKLVWLETFADRGDGSKEQDGWEADSGFGSWYSIEQYFGSDSFGWQVKFEYAVIADHDDPDKAKESAQADFERRALALPSTMPLPAAPQPVAWRWREITSAPDDWHYQAIEPRFINPPHFIVEPLSALTSTEEK